MKTPISRASLVVALTSALVACRDQAGPTKDPIPGPVGSAAAAPAPAPSVTAAAATLPVLRRVPWVAAGAHPRQAAAVEGAVMVVEDFRVGRVVGDGVEWVKKQIPAEYPGFGPNGIDSVHGKWPDEIGVIYSNRNGRAPQPRYTPLTGKGVEEVVAPGGGWATIAGVARVGDATLLVATDLGEGLRFKAVRGSLVRKPQTPEQAGCKEGEVTAPLREEHMRAAIVPQTVAGTPSGTLISFGSLCDKRGPALEVWDKSGKSRIVDLSRWWKQARFARLIPGLGDELWAYADDWAPLLHYKDGEVDALPLLERPMVGAFASPKGELHASDGRTLYRFDGKAWVPVAHITEPNNDRLFMDEQGAIWSDDVARLLPDAAAKPPEPEPCAPFVYLYEPSYNNAATFTYPDTRKALASFPEAADIALVEISIANNRRLGVATRSRAQADALSAHVRATMKDELPRVFCFDPKGARESRVIPLDDKK